MGKIDEVRTAMVKAMKNKEKERKETLSMLLSALKNAQIDKREELTEAEENAVIAREIKQTKETMDTCPPDRTDILRECEERISVLKEFAPEEMSETHIREAVKEVLDTLGIDAPTAKDKGRIMKELMPKVKGRADGKLVNEIVSSLF
ncbi:GatB/YqeY domain-containing protein [Lacrimispora sp. NSJ-141]|uniref:GatB/YqeY domain-containing protein n=1 Tax=Lientehia hominis TaxID=2897778 RepID=A0AAP2RK05_9FIRM|nr:GatB/YqeY domain-containing protein [Lientehia hominis]MCD2493604.1 GatB/YqeY domain-containing protein [Lientehia hominis]